MTHGQPGTALLHRQAITPAAIATLGLALGLYQATSLLLGPAAEREIAVSLSTPTSSGLWLEAPPAAQLLEVGQVVAGRVEGSLLSLAALTPPAPAAERVPARSRLAAPVVLASPVRTPAPAVAPGPQLLGSTPHAAAGGHAAAVAGAGAAPPIRPVPVAAAGQS